jgi:hypothetical protein
MNFLPRLASTCDPPNLSLPCSLDDRLCHHTQLLTFKEGISREECLLNKCETLISTPSTVKKEGDEPHPTFHEKLCLWHREFGFFCDHPTFCNP